MSNDKPILEPEDLVQLVKDFGSRPTEGRKDLVLTKIRERELQQGKGAEQLKKEQDTDLDQKLDNDNPDLEG